MALASRPHWSSPSNVFYCKYDIVLFLVFIGSYIALHIHPAWLGTARYHRLVFQHLHQHRGRFIVLLGSTVAKGGATRSVLHRIEFKHSVCCDWLSIGVLPGSVV